MVKEFAHIDIPYCYRCAFDCTDNCYSCGQQYAAELEQAIEASPRARPPPSFSSPSAAQPSAQFLLPPGYLQRIRGLSRHGMLLHCRRSRWPAWAAPQQLRGRSLPGCARHLVTAKGLSSGYAPLGAVIASKKVIDAIASGSGAFLHGFTYNAHPISLAAGRAVLGYLKTHDLRRSSRLREAGKSRHELAQADSTRCSICRPYRRCAWIGITAGSGIRGRQEDQAALRPEKAFSSRVGQAAMKRGLLVYPMQGSMRRRRKATACSSRRRANSHPQPRSPSRSPGFGEALLQKRQKRSHDRRQNALVFPAGPGPALSSATPVSRGFRAREQNGHGPDSGEHPLLCCLELEALF